MNKVFISCKESRIESNKSFYGCFYLGPFNESESLTIANALRRTLLADCPGVAIISVLIENVNHEYSTLSGVRDSVLDILLNLKEIVLKKSKNPWLTYKPKGISSVYEQVGSSFFKPVVGYLKVKGPGIVRAKDLRLPPFIQCVDPNQYIATLSENGSLNMKFVIMEGKGYIIQKANSFVDYSFVKKRRILFKQLKDLLMKSTWTSIPKGKYTSIGLKEAVNDELFNSQASKKSVMSAKKTLPLAASLQRSGSGKSLREELTKSSSLVSLPSAKRNSNATKDENDLSKTVSEHFENASPLNIDAVFSPIKKVNYIIEVSENKIVNNSNKKYSFMDNISNLMESGDFYKKNFPFLTTGYSAYTAAKTALPLGFTGGVPQSGSVGSKNALRDQNVMQDLLEYVETYSTDELWSSSRSLHPLRKEGALHTIILEIWTNGSLHPREALSMAFSHLTSLFLNLDKTKIFNPIYKNVSSYKKSLNALQHFASSFEIEEAKKTNSLSSDIISAMSGEKTDLESSKRTTQNLDIGKLNMSLRTYTQLKRANIKIIADIVALSQKTLSEYYKLDKKSIHLISKSLEELGYVLPIS